MNVIMRCIYLILVCLPLVVHSNDDSDDSSKDPGRSACYYYGDIDTLCNVATVDPGQIPNDCSSIMFMNAVVDNVTYEVSLALASQIENLNALLACKKKVFLYYTQKGSGTGWPTALKCNTQDGGQRAKCEMEKLKCFLEQYPGITGLVLYYLDPGVFPEDYPCPTENFKVYLEILRGAFPKLSIGFDFATRDLIEFQSKPVGQWLDFGVLDSLLDFYVLNTYTSHTCTPDLIQIGSWPLTGNFPYTTEKAMQSVKQAKIPKEKCLIQYSVSSMSADKKLDPCATSNTMLCTKPGDFCKLCTDSLASFVEKGCYAANNAKGFVIDCIDADDPGSVCCCPSGPFPAFHALLDGMNGVKEPQCCPKYNIFGT